MNRKRYLLLLPLALGSLVITSCGKAPEPWTDGDFNGFKTSILVDESEVTKEFGEYHSAKQIAYIQSTWDQIEHFANGRFELSYPDGLIFDTNKVTLSLTEDFSDTKVYTSTTNKTYIYNFLSNKDYYYKLGDSNEVKTFKSSPLLPRNLFIGGVTNVRDLGGYTSSLGGKLKQGLIYRGGRLTNGRTQLEQKVTANGLKTMTEDLGIKTELDLRADESLDYPPENGNLNNDFFKDLEYINVPMQYTPEDNLLLWTKQVKRAIEVFAEPTNYPIYFHCSIGTDRTGMIGYLLGALLGMDQESLNTDYLFSNFGEIKSSRTIKDIQDKYYPHLRKQGKGTLQRCAESYLLNIGVSADDIQSIKDIMLEK